MKKLLTGLLMLIMALSLCACAKPAEPAAIDFESAGWDAIAEAAEGSTVTFYGWGGDENRNNWLNTTVADCLKKNHDITLQVVGMNIDDILAKLSGENRPIPSPAP